MKYIIVLFLIVFTYEKGYSYKDDRNTKASIEITSQDEVQLDSLSVIYRNNYWSSIGGIVKVDAKVISKGIYEINFNSDEPIAYFTILNKKNNMQQMVLYQGLIQPNDHIKINLLDNGKIEFSGKGSSKLKSVFEIKKAIKIWEAKRADSINALVRSAQIKKNIQDVSYFKARLISSNRRLTSCKEIATAILDRYKKELSSDIFELIKCNIFGDLETENHRVFAFYYSNLSKIIGDKSSSELKEFKAQYYNRSKIDFSLFPSTILLRSGGYQQFIVQLTSKNDLLGEDGFNYINHRYTGELRDRLLTSLLLWSFSDNKNNAGDIGDAIKIVKTGYCKSIILDLYNATMPGKQAFPFKLTDSAGHIVEQKDFFGKVVLLDFYFTGCTGCRGLNEKMLNIFNHYKNNNNIVFVSISIDKNFSIWKEGIKKQLYSHKGSINLFTDGLGDNAPIIEHYKISAYPTLILINKKGQIITANPPKPYDLKKEKELFEILQAAIDM